MRRAEARVVATTSTRPGAQTLESEAIVGSDDTCIKADGEDAGVAVSRLTAPATVSANCAR